MIVHVKNSDDVDEEYDTDNEIGPLFDQVMDEGELMIQEQPLNSTPHSEDTRSEERRVFAMM